MKNKKPTIIFIALLTAFTTYISLDTFVISSVYQAEATEMNTKMFDNVEKSEGETDASSGKDSSSSNKSRSSNEDSSNSNESQSSEKHHGPGNGKHGKKERSSSTDTGTTELSVSDEVTDIGNYTDNDFDITVKEYTVNDTKVYVADVTVNSAETIKTAFANDTFGKNVTDTTSSIASSHDAILAINGDYYGAQESGYVIRNGIVYRSESDGEDVLCLYADGSMKVVDPSTVTAEELVSEGVWQAFSFGPGLVEDGKISVSENDEVGKAMASNPRTAIGMTDAGHYLFVVSDGRSDESEGLSLYELADFMKSLGATTAYNLDGGGSSTMYFNGEVINNPTTTGNSSKERSVSDIVYIK